MLKRELYRGRRGGEKRETNQNFIRSIERETTTPPRGAIDYATARAPSSSDTSSPAQSHVAAMRAHHYHATHWRARTHYLWLTPQLPRRCCCCYLATRQHIVAPSEASSAVSAHCTLAWPRPMLGPYGRPTSLPRQWTRRHPSRSHMRPAVLVAAVLGSGQEGCRCDARSTWRQRQLRQQWPQRRKKR